MNDKRYLIGRVNVRVSPPVIDMIRLMECPAGSLTSFGQERWVDLMPPGSKLDIIDTLIRMQDYYRWMEPMLDPHLAVECLRLQGIDEPGIGLDLHMMQFDLLNRSRSSNEESSV